MTTLLSVTRRRFQGKTTIHHLAALSDGQFAVRPGEGASGQVHVIAGARTAVEAITRSRRLRQADIRDHTAYVLPDGSPLTEDQVLDAIRTRGTDDPRLDEDPDTDYLFGDVDLLWSTRHDITINRRHVFGAPGTPYAVRAWDYRRPYQSWPEVISLDWDSSEYAGVGNAGYGTSGAYRPRAGLLAHVMSTDESLEISFHKTPANARTLLLAQGALDAGIFPEDIYAHLILKSYGFDAGDFKASDVVTVQLDPADLRSLLQPVLAAAPQSGNR